MPEISVFIPQIGEGLQEARLVAVLKKPGEHVRRDEPIYQMETDKAVMDVESPYEGELTEWLAEVDSVLPIGAAVAKMLVEEVDGESEWLNPPVQPDSPEVHEAPKAGQLPPRTRAYAKEKGLTETELAGLAAASAKLMPSDIDAFLATRTTAKTHDDYDQLPLSSKQRLLASRISRGTALVVPGTMTVVADWSPITRAREKTKADPEFSPSSFTIFAFAVTRALQDFPAFRSTLVGDETVRTYKHVSLGIAVGLPGDELVLAVIEKADTLSWRLFAEAARERIALARTGKDQANESMVVSLTNMQSFKLRDAVPIVVAPAIATLFLGEVFPAPAFSASGEVDFTPSVNLTLTFDHRLINGVGAAQFLNAVKHNVENISRLFEEE